MSNTINVNIAPLELCKEDRQRLDEVIGFLGMLVGQVGEIGKQVQPATAPLPAQETPNPAAEHPVGEISPHGDPEPVAEPEPEAPKWTKEDLQARVQALAAPGTGKREQVRAIVKSYAEKVGDIPADKYDEVMEKLTALEQEG